MNSTTRGNRLHMAIFGRRNVGKSSLINALTNQDIALVSAVPGTTTDPVYKAMEILPLGPVVIIDTAGIDDTGTLGELRVQRSKGVLSKADLVLLVVDASQGLSPYELDIIEQCRGGDLPVIAVVNKIDQHPFPQEEREVFQRETGLEPVAISALTGDGLAALKVALIHGAPAGWEEQAIVADLIESGDLVILVTPIDSAAPKGRLILPQVQTIRDILDKNALSLVVKETELATALASLKEKPKLVVTDSQVFRQVAAVTPPDIALTSFSILFARHKGDLAALVEGARTIDGLRPGDRVLMAEACSHHRTEDDIGTVKIPRWLEKHVGGPLAFQWVNGHAFPADLASYRLIIHCGGCMINRREMLARLAWAREAGVPMVNYGVAITHLQGLLPRALSPFPDLVGPAQVAQDNELPPTG